MKKNKWYDENELPSLGIITHGKDISKMTDNLLNLGLSDCKWRYSETETATDCFMQLLKVPLLDADVRNSVRCYLSSFVNRFVTLDDIQEMATVYAGWKPEFKSGEVFEKWTGSPPVWAVFYIETTKYSTVPGLPYELHLRAVAGPSTGLSVIKKTDAPGARRLFYALISYKGDMLDEPPSPLYLGGLYMTALLETQEKKLDITQVFASSAQKTYNKRLMSERESHCCGPWSSERKTCTPYCPYERSECILSTHADKRPKTYCRNVSVRHMGYIMSDGYCSRCLREGLVDTRSNKNEEPT